LPRRSLKLLIPCQREWGAFIDKAKEDFADRNYRGVMQVVYANSSTMASTI
jgi:hypothetical protein